MRNGDAFKFIRSVLLVLAAVVTIMFVFSPAPTLAQTCTFTNSGLDFGSVDLTPGIWGSKVWAHPPNHKVINMRLNASGTASRSRVIRGEIYAGQSGTPAGLYTSGFSGSHTLIAYAYRSVGNCALISSLGGIQLPFNVSANVLGTCTVSATDLNFGTTGILSANQDATNAISVTCSNLTPYTIGLDDGLNGIGSPTARRMVNGGASITYAIYQNAARTSPWGDTTGTNTISGTGTGSPQTYTTYGRVPAQTTPPAATYTDTVVVTVTY